MHPVIALCLGFRVRDGLVQQDETVEPLGTDYQINGKIAEHLTQFFSGIILVRNLLFNELLSEYLFFLFLRQLLCRPFYNIACSLNCLQVGTVLASFLI